MNGDAPLVARPVPPLVARPVPPKSRYQVAYLNGGKEVIEAHKLDVGPVGELLFTELNVLGGVRLTCLIAPGQWRRVQPDEGKG